MFESSVDLNVPDEAYSVNWDGNFEVPTKNAIYDKIEALDTIYDGNSADFAGEGNVIFDGGTEIINGGTS